MESTKPDSVAMAWANSDCSWKHPKKSPGNSGNMWISLCQYVVEQQHLHFELWKKHQENLIQQMNPRKENCKKRHKESKWPQVELYVLKLCFIYRSGGSIVAVWLYRTAWSRNLEASLSKNAPVWMYSSWPSRVPHHHCSQKPPRQPDCSNHQCASVNSNNRGRHPSLFASYVCMRRKFNGSWVNGKPSF